MSMEMKQSNKLNAGKKTSGGITGIEEKAIGLVERFMPYLIVVIVSGMALYIRKIALWYNFPDVITGFDKHDGFIQSWFYYLLMRVVQILPMTPLHSFKWIASLSDFVVAALFALLAERKNRLKQALIYMIMLFSPILLLRGIIWAQMDSLAMIFLLAAVWLGQKEGMKTEVQNILVGILAALGCAMVPQMLLFVAAYCFYKKKHRVLFGVVLLVFAIQFVSILLLEGRVDFVECFYCNLRFFYCEPFTGHAFADFGKWLCGVLTACGFGACVFSALLAVYKADGRSMCSTLMIHVIVTMLYCSYLFTIPTIYK